MLDENLIATLETSLRQTRNSQNRLMSRLREAEEEAKLLRQEIEALENSAAQMESAIDGILVSLRGGNRSYSLGKTARIENEPTREKPVSKPLRRDDDDRGYRKSGSVTYINQNRGVPSISTNIEPISHRFSDRTITQACTLLLRESGKALHVNELYNLLVAGGMEFKGNNPTISVAVSLNRNRRFRKVAPGTFDLTMREASQAAS
jgi:hypothetical protein